MPKIQSARTGYRNATIDYNDLNTQSKNKIEINIEKRETEDFENKTFHVES